MERLSVVVPSYNAQALLCRALEAVTRVAPDAEVIVVDGGSRDGSADAVRQRFPGVRLVEAPNHGWGAATNRGLLLATGDLVLFLNSDLFLNGPALSAMRARLADPAVGAVGPFLLNEDGTRQPQFSWLYWPRYIPVVGPIAVPLASGACLMTRRDVLERVGGLDEGFFMYNEEYDWCGRVRDAGYRIELVPFGAIHVGGGSTVPSPSLVLETHRGFLYLASKRYPRVVLEGLRRAMQLKGWFFKRFDGAPAMRPMWAELESLAADGDYRRSPFPLSGRTVVDLRHPSAPSPENGDDALLRAAE